MLNIVVPLLVLKLSFAEQISFSYQYGKETNSSTCQRVFNKLDTMEIMLKRHTELLQQILENKTEVPLKTNCVIKEVASTHLTGQSSDSPGWENSSRNAVDGNLSTMSHTGQDNQPYWWVDLGTTYKVERIEIYNRQGCCSERLHDLDVQVGPSLDNLSLCSHYKGPGQNGEHIILSCFENIRGRFVKLIIRGTEWLHLPEVKVYGCNSRA